MSTPKSFTTLNPAGTVRWKRPDFSPGIIIGPEPTPIYFVTLATNGDFVGVGPRETPRLNLVENWFDGLERLVPTEN